MRRGTKQFPLSDSRRGTVLLVVMALLSMVTLSAILMTYLSKMEVLAARNAGQQVAQRMSTVTGIPLVASQVHKKAWQPAPRAQGIVASANTENSTRTIFTGLSSPDNITVASAIAAGSVSDLSGRLNINTLLDATTVNALQSARKIDKRRNGKNTQDEAVSPRLTQDALESLVSLLRADPATSGTLTANTTAHIMMARETKRKENAPKRAKTRSGEQDAEDKLEDLTGATTPNNPLEYNDLHALPGITPKGWKALEPYITLHSSALELWRDPEGVVYPRVPLNEASAEEILLVLETLYPNAEATALAQFAVNIIDRRDADSVPTQLPEEPGAWPILGFEENLVIAEVCPDVMSAQENGDNGEYIEIYNPLDETVDIEGWSLDWPGGTQRLSGRLRPGAFLLLTDDLNDGNDPSPEEKVAPGMGSFYEVFGLLPGGENLFIEAPGLEIAEGEGIVRLYDPAGQTIDYLAYNNGTFDGLNLGFERESAYTHIGQAAKATPFALRTEIWAEPDADLPEWDRLRIEEYTYRRNQPYQSPVELLAVPSTYASPGALRSQAGSDWPQLGIIDHDRPNLRMLDAFTVDALASPFDSAGDLRPYASEDALSTRTAPLTHGKINLNTAPLPVLAVLPHIEPALARRIAESRPTEHASPNHATFEQFSDFTVRTSLWENMEPAAVYEAWRTLCPVVTFNSLSCEMVSARMQPENQNTPASARLYSRSVLEMTPEGWHVLDWRMQWAIFSDTD